MSTRAALALTHALDEHLHPIELRGDHRIVRDPHQRFMKLPIAFHPVRQVLALGGGYHIVPKGQQRLDLIRRGPQCHQLGKHPFERFSDLIRLFDITG